MALVAACMANNETHGMHEATRMLAQISLKSHIALVCSIHTYVCTYFVMYVYIFSFSLLLPTTTYNYTYSDRTSPSDEWCAIQFIMYEQWKRCMHSKLNRINRMLIDHCHFGLQVWHVLKALLHQVALRHRLTCNPHAYIHGYRFTHSFSSGRTSGIVMATPLESLQCS